MANEPTPKKPFWKSKNFWNGIATITASAFMYFGIQPDPTEVALITDTAETVVESVETKNWIAIGVLVLNSGNVLFHLFKTWFGKQD